ncbi:hypothetical protein TWF102_000350 [Orbilia oligospora]|uniref:Uncharacterized protein n=1 Tax=Orbilia oligospora TaxID=2813651 RepID=A0A7C8JEX3_ORBOL|nr:hypothetical protein TWF102_000350 [Orbilia oligospora]KAF3115950.1 hypothetical protein TWF103_010178 [Orbilia oligospora]KAF3138228.1 hypothetical protein TWF703_004757 [Orbilia oligospora]
MGKAKKAKAKAKRERKFQERSDEIADEPVQEARVQIGGHLLPLAAGQAGDGLSSSPPAATPALPNDFAAAMRAWELSTRSCNFSSSNSSVNMSIPGHDSEDDGGGRIKKKKDQAMPFRGEEGVVTEKNHLDAAIKPISREETAASKAGERKDAAVPKLKQKKDPKVEEKKASKVGERRTSRFEEQINGGVKIRYRIAEPPGVWLRPCEPGPPPTRSVKSLAEEAAQKVYNLADAKARRASMTSTSQPSPSSPSPSSQRPFTSSFKSYQGLLTSLFSTKSLIHGIENARSLEIKQRYADLIETLLHQDLAEVKRSQEQISIMASALNQVQQNQDHPELQAELRVTATESQQVLSGILAGKSHDYLSGFLDSIKWSAQLEEITAAKQKEACMRAGIRILPSKSGSDDPALSLAKIPTTRQNFIKQMIRATPHLSKTLFDNNILNDDNSIQLWLDDGEIRWAEIDAQTSHLELAAFKGRFSSTHQCVGNDKDERSMCLSCLMEMEWDHLLDFAPALGLPRIRRPKGWKPPVDKETETAPEVQPSSAIDKSSSNLPSETRNLDLQEPEEEVQATKAPTEPEAGQKKKKNKKKKKKSAASQVGNEPQPAENSAFTPIQKPSIKPTLLPNIPEQSSVGVSRVAQGVDGKSVEFEYITGPAARAIHEQYKKFLPTAILDDAKFKFSGHGQPEREISGKEMRALLHKEMLACNEEDPEFTTAVLQSIMTDTNIEGPGLAKQKSKASAKIPVALLSAEPKSPQPVETPVEKPKTKTKAKSSNRPHGLTPLEEYNMLRAQRLELVLGIGRFVIESICAGKRPCFDVSLDGRIEFGHADLLYPIRMIRAGYDDTTDKNPPLSVGIDTDYTEVKMVTAPIVSIRDKETPDIGDGMNNVIRDFHCPNVITIQEMFRDVDMVHATAVDSEGEAECEGTPSGSDEKVGNPVPEGTTFGLKTSVKRAKAKAKAGAPVFLGSQKYQILPSDGPQGEHPFSNMRSLTKSFCRALDICEDTQTWVKNQKRNIALRDVLGDDPLWPVNPSVPRKPIDGSDSKPATKPAPTKPVPVKKPGTTEAGKLADLAKELNEKEQMAAMMTVERDEMLALMERFPPGRKRTELGFEAHLKTMNECLEGIEANNRKVKALIQETLRDHPWSPSEES